MRRTAWQLALKLVAEHESDANDTDLAASHGIPPALIRLARQKTCLESRSPKGRARKADPFGFVP
jgi:hypothetical protein